MFAASVCKAAYVRIVGMTPPRSLGRYAPAVRLGVWGVVEPKRRLSGSIEWSITGKSICGDQRRLLLRKQPR